MVKANNNLDLTTLTAFVLGWAALAGGRGQGLTVVCPPLEGPHALLDGAHHVPVEAVAVLAGILSHDVRTVGVVGAAHVAAGLGRGLAGGDYAGADQVSADISGLLLVRL